MHGGVIPLRGAGADACRCVEADRCRADDYYLDAEATVAQFAALDGEGTVPAEVSLHPAAYAAWVDWTNPVTGERMDKPRRAGSDRRASPRFMEMVINTPKSLSIAAALHPEVSAALDAAQQDALAEIRRWLARHSGTRVGSLGAQEVVPVESMQVVGIAHRTSRAGDPHRHIHMQIGTRIWAVGKWRGLDNGALFKQQGVIRASGDPLVVVEGAAGSGKTSMLATAIKAAEHEGRSVRVVAPTKKAAEVAHQVLGVPADSVAALVYAYGWRWNSDGVWTRLTPGDIDPVTGGTYTNPPETARLRAGERVVVDEAGMLDQDSALALFALATEQGATLALVGDRAQLPAVGRGGVLDMAATMRGRSIDMTVVHRFTDPTYADLTLRLRDRDDPAAILDRLYVLGLIRLYPDTGNLHEHIAAHRADGEAVTVATNEQATDLNQRIRDTRVQAGIVDDQITATGSDGLPIGRGDLIQTRKNDTSLGVANLQQWIVCHVAQDGEVWAVEASSDRKRAHTVRLPAGYVTEHTHLSYASTAYGVQGITTGRSHTILTDAMSGAAVYVGMTRGTDENQLHIIAESLPAAREQFIDAVQRDRADRGLPDATQHAAQAVRGLVEDGPVKAVKAEIAALTTRAERAEQRAALWQQAADALTDLYAQQHHEREQARYATGAAKQNLDAVRAHVARPLTKQASHAPAQWRDADTAQRTARDRLATAGRFGKRRATSVYDTARVRARHAERQLTREWGEPPRWNEDQVTWVDRAIRPRIDADQRVIDAAVQYEAATKALNAALRPDDLLHLRIYARIFGAQTVTKNPAAYLNTRPASRVEDATRTAEQARAEIAALRSLTPTEAVERINQTRATEHALPQAAEHAFNEHQHQLPDRSHVRDSGPRYDEPGLIR